MALFGNMRGGPSDAAQAYTANPTRQSPLQFAGTLADTLLTGGLFHALNQRSLRQGLLAAQQQDGQRIAGMFSGPTTTQSAAAPLPDAASGVNLFAGGKYGPAPDQTFGGDSTAMTPGHIPSVEEALPFMAQAHALHGTDVSQFLAMIQAAEPKTQVYNGVAYDPRKLAPGSRVGVNLSPVNGFMVDPNDPAMAGRYMPSLEKGQEPVYDQNGRVTGVRNMDGAVGSSAAAAGAVSDAQEWAKANYDLVDVPLANGSTIKMPRSLAVRRLGGAGAPAAAPTAPAQAPAMGAGDGFGVSQTPQDKTYADEQAKAAAGRYQQIQTAGSQAPAKIAQYQQLGRMFDGVNGNRLSPTGLELSRFAKSMGFNVDPKLGNKEAGVALANQIALTLRDPSNGGGMPGSMSNSDRQFLTNMVPNLAQSDAGRKQLVDIYVAKASRDQDVAAMARKWQQRYQRIDTPDANGATFEDQLQKWAEMHPLFGKH